MQMDMVNLFPIPVGKCKFGRPFSLAELSFLTAQQTRKTIGNFVSTDSNILNNPELSDIRAFIQSSIDDYFIKVYAPKYDVRLRLIQSWANYTSTSEYHHVHNHANSFLTGVLYVQTDAATDRILFRKPIDRELGIIPVESNDFNSRIRWFESRVGELLLFPSYLTHSVDPVVGEHTRISIAFNAYPVGQIGDPNTLSSLVLT